MLTAETIATVKATVPALRDHGETITAHFYQVMFRDYPEVKAYFNQSHQAQGTQPRALAGSVLAYAENIDHLEALEGALPRIIQKHVALDIRPGQFITVLLDIDGQPLGALTHCPADPAPITTGSASSVSRRGCCCRQRPRYPLHPLRPEQPRACLPRSC